MKSGAAAAGAHGGLSSGRSSLWTTVAGSFADGDKGADPLGAMTHLDYGWAARRVPYWTDAAAARQSGRTDSHPDDTTRHDATNELRADARRGENHVT